MPILDPILQCNLLKKMQTNVDNEDFSFYFRYLRIASRNINKNYTTIKTSIQFKNDLKASIQLINKKFSCNLTKKDLNNSTNIDFYKYFYKHISNVDFETKRIVKLEGIFFKQAGDQSLKFFHPNIIFNKNHSWFFSDSPIGILCINLDDFSYIDFESEFFQSIILETDLLIASGFSLVLCFNYSEKYSLYLFDLIMRNQFTEIHINFLNNNEFEHFLKEIKTKYEYKLDSFGCYFYLYSPHIRKDSLNHETFKKLKHNAQFSILTFFNNVQSAIKDISFKGTQPFAYCKTGFKYDKMRIKLSNVPLYDEESNFIPSDTSGIMTCFISRTDFLSWKNTRVKILFYDEQKFQSSEKYINSEDIHKVRKDLYVENTLLLAKTDENTLKTIDEIDEKIRSIIKKRRNKKFSKKTTFSFYKDKLVKNGLEYVAHAYACSKSLTNDFFIHKPQLFAALEASKVLLLNNNFLTRSLIKQKKQLENLLLSNDNINNSEPILPTNLQTVLSSSSLSSDIKEVVAKCLLKHGSSSLNSIPIYYNDTNKKSIKSSLEKINKKLNANKNYDDSNGIIYQVETGEGKSCIISLIAAILALNGKTVHITSSNIKLSNRDYMESYDFFDALGLKTAVLLHDNELPYANEKKKRSINKTNVNIPTDKNSNKNDNEIDDLFKDNMDNYYETFTKDDNNVQYKKYYMSKDCDYYREIHFKNPSRMNFAVCGLDLIQEKIKKSPNIIFSTIVNFECFYLKLLEINPGEVDEYFDKCALLIDEADSILIDEITNGTIVSKEMKSNMKEVLLHVYHNKKKGVDEEKTLKEVKKQWPKCVDLEINDIRKMYAEIELVNQKEFQKKYSIEEFEVKSNKKKNKLFKNALNFVKDVVIQVGKGMIKELTKNDNENGEEEDDEDEDDDDEDGDDDDEEEEDDDDYNSTKVFKYIVPFDYEHKGILEKNKEFDGFIQQFIAIKESEENKVENMIIKNISMSYLYVSHPIFVKLYGKVCGFTGTIGKKEDKELYKSQYNLRTFKVPRNKPNKRVELPIILCKSIEERNNKIIAETLEFHKRGNPVLVIFQDLNEINEVGNLLNQNGIKYYNVFNGKNENVTPEKIAGQESSISLGTNVCGRGTSIIAYRKPLHVIISYYTSNIRVIRQAQGRTARQGKQGTSRIICLREQFLYPALFSENGIDAAIEEFRIKDEMQAKYIELFKSVKPWIFSNEIDKQVFNKEEVQKMRDVRININRIVAYNYEFPLKMTVKTFLNIQAQKIFSIVNCPNSMYTWRLFQRYVREMIFESWSLMINNVDQTFFQDEKNKKYKKELERIKNKSYDTNSKEYKDEVKNLNQKFVYLFNRYENNLMQKRNELLELLNDYLPFDIDKIVPSFMYIFTKVANQYGPIIFQSFKLITNDFISYDKVDFMSCYLGFKPYSLLTESGARINYRNYSKINYIKDPELKYLKKTRKKFCLLSITEKIDDVFNRICQIINNVMGKKTFLKFFMRRTLFGTEFGICFDFSVENVVINDPNCLFDKDPLLLFTISVKSVIPILAGILIILLVYLASIAKNISEWIGASSAKLTKEFALRTIFLICETASSNAINLLLDKIIDYLKKTLKNQVEQLRVKNSQALNIAAEIIEMLGTVFDSSIGDAINSKISKFLGEQIKINFKWTSFIGKCLDKVRVVKLSIFFLLCAASFMMNFNSRKNAIDTELNTANKYEKSLKTDEKIENKNKLINHLMDENSEDIDGINSNPSEDHFLMDKIDKDYSNVEQQYIYKYRKANITKKIVKFVEFYDDKEEIINDSIKLAENIKYVIQKKGNTNKKCIRFQYSGFKKALFEQIRILATNQCPNILNFVGYSIHKKQKYLFFENKGKGTLKDLTDYTSHQAKLNRKEKVKIALGIAQALEHLHENNIVYRNLQPSSIIYDKSYNPYLSNFCYAVQIDSKLPYLLTEMEPEFTPPEFIQDFKSNQTSFKIDIYAYGMILYMLLNEENPFTGRSRSEILSDTLKGERPKFNIISKEWNELIIKCWNQDPSLRPDIKTIKETIMEWKDYKK